MRSRGVRRVITSAVVAVAAVVAGPGAAVAAGSAPISPRVAEQAALAAKLTGKATAKAAVTPAARSARPVSASTTALLVARYSFDRGAVVDESGRGHTLRRVAAGGGKTRVVGHAGGKAVAFPKKCKAKRCPRAVLQAPTAADLNPGTRRFAFGAVVKLAKRQTSKGQNVVQKGYSKASSQYKLQIDGKAGRPSCVLVDAYRPTIRIARSNRSVADNSWHTIECRRSGTVLAIRVDGAVAGKATVPARLKVTNNRPLSIGGKGAYRDNDQFQGAVDDVWVTIG